MKAERRTYVKLLTLGDSGGGKSSLLLRYTDPDALFSDEFVTTIGMDFKFKRVTVDNTPLRVQIWDTAGQERFRTITQNYYHGAHGILFVYGLDKDYQRHNISRWLADVKRMNNGEPFDAILVANKSDLLKDSPEELEEAEAKAKDLAEKLGIDYFITSAKDNINVNEAFETLIQKVYKRVYSNKPIVRGGAPLYLQQEENTSSCAC